jgi:hypothetical protein
VKTAVIVAGVCRYCDIPSKTWDIFPFEADLYLSTWDITNDTFSNELFASDVEIDIIKENTKANKNCRLINVIVSDYRQAILENKIKFSYNRPLFLLQQVLKILKEKQYTRIIYFRPDLYINTLSELTENDFDIDDSSVSIIGMGEPEYWTNEAKNKMEDHFFCMTMSTFEKFIHIFNVSNLKVHDIHEIFFNFFKKNNIQIKKLNKMRCVLVRKETENYYKSTNEELSLHKMMEIYLKVYIEKTNSNHIVKINSINLDYLKFNSKPDYKLLEQSKAQGGILKLRK